jgi:hypothetical protein
MKSHLCMSWPWWNRRPTEMSAVEILQRFYPHALDPTTLELRANVRMAKTG